MLNTTKLRNSILLILVATTLCFAQTFRGTILGTVSDPNGAVVGGAKVIAKNTTTDEAGNYTIPELPVGTYEVRVEQTGFTTGVVSGVAVAVASERRIDVNLTVAGQENVVVVAPAVQAETTTNTLGGTITAKAA